jgi:hypothetical protein
MCGFSGIFYIGGNAPKEQTKRELEGSFELLKHRYLVFGNALAHLSELRLL